MPWHPGGRRPGIALFLRASVPDSVQMEKTTPTLQWRQMDTPSPCRPVPWPLVAFLTHGRACVPEPIAAGPCRELSEGEVLSTPCLARVTPPPA